MNAFDTMNLPARPDTIAPDGSEVRILLGLDRGGMAHFALEAGQTSKAIIHRTVEEIWFFVSGQGEMWREQDGRSRVVDVQAGTCLTIPLGTRFQFHAFGKEPLSAIGVTMPPWPGEAEAVIVDGKWRPTFS